MSSASRTSRGYYDQSLMSLPSCAINATGLIGAGDAMFTQPVEIFRIGFIQNGTAVNAGTSIRFVVSDIYGPSGNIIRTSGHLVVPTLLGAANGIGHWTDLNVEDFGPLRADPGEQVKLEVVVAGAVGQTIMPGFMYRALGWNRAGPLDQDGAVTTVDRLVNMTEVTATA